MNREIRKNIRKILDVNDYDVTFLKLSYDIDILEKIWKEAQKELLKELSIKYKQLSRENLKRKNLAESNIYSLESNNLNNKFKEVNEK